MRITHPYANASRAGPTFVNGQIQTYIVRVDRMPQAGREPGVVDTPLWKGQGCYNDPCEKIAQNPCWNNSCWIEATGVDNWCADTKDNCDVCGGLWCTGTEKESDRPVIRKEPGGRSHFELGA